jgi:hypothetical protein
MRGKALVFALLAAGAAILSCAPRDEAPSVARVTPLDRGAIPALRDSFNAAADRPRVLVLLSPT